MKIVELQAENFKRLRAVDITPGDGVVVVAGRNGQGKTSVLDAIWHALGGGAASRGTGKPIREGASGARAVVDLGEIVVERKWTANDRSYLEVRNADGVVVKSPQKLLDSLVGGLSFDPLEFARMEPKRQRATLLTLVPLPFDPDKLDEEYKATFDRRTAVKRERDEVSAATAQLGRPEPNLPETVLSASDLIDRISRLEERRRSIEAAYEAMNAAAVRVNAAKKALSEAEAAKAAADQAFELIAGDGADPYKELPELKTQLETVEQTNEKIRHRDRVRTLIARTGDLNAKVEELSRRLADIERTRTEGIKNAAFPVPGLGFDDDGVTINGIPFGQCSSAEQLKVSLAMACALNPKIRVIRITDGSLLDEDSMEQVREIAARNDMQVWVEVVGNGGAGAVVIEDGEVVSE